MKLFLASQHSHPGMIGELLTGGDGRRYLTQGDRAAMKLFLAGDESRHWIHDLYLFMGDDMRLYMAGGVSGNLKPLWREIANKIVYDGMTFDAAKDEAMKIFLAGGYPNGRQDGAYDACIQAYHPYILESFYYVDQDTERLLPYFGDFLLDSGAFTFMQGTKGNANWDEYIERYAAFIRKNKIEKYFELDIDSVVGYDKVKQFRKDLERQTGSRCIPVWHLSRGLDDFKRMCDEYDYVAIGGIVSGEIKATKYSAFPALISEAHKRGAKIHGLGFTALDWLSKCHFDSVDSTAWTTGNRFGFAYYFNGHTMKKRDAPDGHRLGDSRKVALNNYTEWLKYQKWADTHL